MIVTARKADTDGCRSSARCGPTSRRRETCAGWCCKSAAAAPGCPGAPCGSRRSPGRPASAHPASPFSAGARFTSPRSRPATSLLDGAAHLLVHVLQQIQLVILATVKATWCSLRQTSCQSKLGCRPFFRNHSAAPRGVTSSVKWCSFSRSLSQTTDILQNPTPPDILSPTQQYNSRALDRFLHKL